MDRLAALTLFARVVETGSLAAAARAERLSPAAATRALAALEARLGTRLIQRSTRRMALTEAGRAFYPRARRLLSELEEAEASSGALAPRGRLVVALPTLLGRLRMGTPIADLLARYPDLAVEARYADRAVNLLEEGVDCAIRVGPLEDSALIARRLGAFRRLVVGAPGHLDATGRPARPEELARRAVVRFAALPTTWRFADGAREIAVRVTGRAVADEAEAALDLARRGVGLTLAPEWQVAEDVAAGRLEVVLAGFPTPETPVHAVFPEIRLLSAKVRAFVGIAAEHLGAPGALGRPP